MRNIFRMLSICGILASTVTGCVTPTVPSHQRVLYDDASKMNSLSVGMTKAQMIEVMGIPATSSARSGIECAEYQLLEHSTDFYQHPSSYYVIFIGGKISEFGRGACSDTSHDIGEMNRAIGHETINSLSIGMPESDVLTTISNLPNTFLIRRETYEKYGIGCVNYITDRKQRFVAFKNGKLIASGNSLCDIGMFKAP